MSAASVPSSAFARRGWRLLVALGLTAAAGGVHAACAKVLDHQFVPLAAEKPISLCQYERKVVLVVNTASRCGYTHQYEGLEKLWRRHRDRGLVVLGFPANDFGQQEPGSNAQIAEFCKANYGVTFPMFEKLDEPITRQPMFAELARLSGQSPKWNFQKYLIDRNGKVTAFPSRIEPDSAEMTRAIDAALAR